jgi:phosphoglycerate dehydrogenase-like enzyme
VVAFVTERLRERGHRVDVFPSARHFFARRDALDQADVLLALGGLRVDRQLLTTAPKLRAVVAAFTGTDGFDETAASELGILVANGHAVENIEAMAEATVLMALAVSYDLAGATALMDSPNARRPAHMLAGKIIGFVGHGQIARAVHRRLDGWKARFLVATPRAPEPLPADMQYVALDDLMAQSDIVSVHASLNDATRHLIDGRRLRTLRPSAIFINTSRGAIVDEAALIEVARERPDVQFALDTFEREPLAAENSLRTLPNVVLTPHCIGHTTEGTMALRELALENVALALEGAIPRCVRNPSVIPGWLKRWARS